MHVHESLRYNHIVLCHKNTSRTYRKRYVLVEHHVNNQIYHMRDQIPNARFTILVNSAHFCMAKNFVTL